MLHKRKTKLIALILSVCLIVTMMPAMAFASTPSYDTSESEVYATSTEVSASAEEVEEVVKDISEVTEDDVIMEKSSESITTFDLGGGHEAKVFYSYDVRYLDDEGNLVEFDPELVDIENETATEQGTSLDGYKYVNKQGKYKHYIPEDISESTPLLMENGKYSISMAPTGNLRAILNQSKVKGKLKKDLVQTASNQTKNKNVIVAYGDSSDEAYLEYTSMTDSVKEAIVLTEVPKKNEFTFKVTLKGLTYKMNSNDGGITFLDPETDDIIAAIEAPFMNDATGNAYSEAITYTMERRGNSDNYTLTMTVDEEYLNDEARVYPVTIDPTATWVGSSQIQDAYIISGYPTTNYYSSSVTKMVSGTGTDGKHRTPMKILNLKAAIEDCDIESAYMDIYETGGGLSGMVVRFYAITDSWTASTVTWNTCPGWGTASDYIDYNTSTGTAYNKLRFDVTTWVRSVAAGGSNYGLMLKNQVEASTSYCEFFGSRTSSTSYRPKLTVTYTVDEPSVPSTVTASKSVYAVGENIVVSWTGITADSLDHVEYRVATCDEDGNEINSQYVPYTDLVTTSSSSGTATIPNSSSFPEGYYAIYIRGVSSTSENGTGKHVDVQVAADKPTTATTVWSYNDGDYAVGEYFIIYWTGITGDFLDHYEYRIAECDEDGNIIDTYKVPYTDISTVYTGSSYKYAIIPCTDPDTNGDLATGMYKIYIRGVSSNGTNGTGKHCNVYITDTPGEIGELYFLNSSGTTISSGQYVGVQTITAVGDEITNDETVVSDDFLHFLYDPSGNHIKTGFGASISNSSTSGYKATNTISSSYFTTSGAYPYYLFYFDEIDGENEINFLQRNIYIDNTVPFGSINLYDSQLGMEVSEAEGLIDIAVWPRDSHSGVSTSSLRLYQGTSASVGTEVTAEFTGDSFSDQMIYELDTTTLADGNYVLKMTITDNVGLSATVYKDFIINNPIATPTVTAAMDSGNAQLDVTWSYEQAMSDLASLQYSLDGSETWQNLSISSTQQGTFSVTLPEGTSGSHYISVRAIDTEGNPSESVRTDFAVDSAVPVVQITNIDRGVVTGTVSDDNLTSWTISVKVKDSTDEYVTLNSGETVVESGRIGVADLSAATYASDTWYTIEVIAIDGSGNESYDTFDVYKDSSYASAYLIESANWILRGLGQNLQEKNFVISAEQNTLKLNGSSGLSSAAWFINGLLAGSTVDYTSDFSTYTEGTENSIAVAAKKTDGSIVLSKDVYMNAAEDTFAFGNSTTSEVEKTVTLSQNAVAFILDAPTSFTVETESVEEPSVQEAVPETGSEVEVVSVAEETEHVTELTTEESEEVVTEETAFIEVVEETMTEDMAETLSTTTDIGITYYAKVDNGEYQQITPGQVVYIYGLNDQMISANTITVKAVAADGTVLGDLGSFSLQLGIMEEETFSVSSAEIYWPEELAIADKVNYKTYLTWANEADRPETVYYQVYRSTFEGFEPNELTLVADHVTDNYWVDINLNYGTDLYYRVRAVTVDANGDVVSVSRYSNEVVSRAMDEDEYTKNLGHQDYWAYADVATPSGSGYIEKSQGNFLYEQTDVEVANEKLPMDITRTYNSMATSKSIFGYGWTFTYDIELLRLGYSDDLSSGSLVLRDGSGTIYRFKESGDTYISSLGKYVDLTKADLSETIVLPVREGEDQGREVTVTSAYTMTTRDGIEYRFNSSGKLIYMKEDNGNQLFFDYDEDKGVLTKITTGNNIEIQLNYQTESDGDAYLVNEIVLPDGQKVAYSYSSTSNLTGVTKTSNTGTESISYAYTYTSSKMCTLSDGVDNVYTVGYSSVSDGIANSFTYPAAGSSSQEIINVNRDASTGNATTTKVVGGQEVTRTVDYFSGTEICIQHEEYSGDTLLNSVSYEYKDNLLMKTLQSVTYDELQITTDSESGITSAAIVTVPTAKVETYTYTEDETVDTETATDGAVGTYTYGLTGKYSYLPTEYKETVTDEDGDSYEVVHEAYVYDSYGNLIKLTDYINQTVTVYTYFTGTSDKAKGAIASEANYTCDENGNYTESNKTSYTSTTYSFAADGTKTETVTSVSDGNSTVTTTVYDVMGNVTSEVIVTTSSNGKINRESYTYTLDGFGRVTSTTTVKELLNSDGTVQEGTTSTTIETKTYDANNTIATETGADGIQKTYTYDALNRVVSILERNTETGDTRYTATAYTYEDVSVNEGKAQQKTWNNALVTTETTKSSATATSGTVTNISYQNGLGQVVRQTVYGVTTDYTYDGNGNRITEYVITDSDTNAGRLTYHVYDKEGRETATVYNPVYNVITDSFAVGEDTIYEATMYDEAGNVSQTVDGEGNVIKYAYDEAGRLVKVTQYDDDGNAINTTFSYTTVNVSENNSYELITMTNAKEAVSTEKADSNGNVIETSDNGISGETGIDKITTSYTYDANGNMLKEIRGTGTTEYTYNSRNLMTKKVETDANGNAVYMTEYTYVDGSDLIATMADYQYQDETAVKYRHTEYTYDGLNRLKTFAEMNTSLETPDTTNYRITYTYDFNDNITEIAYGSALGSEVDKVKYSYTNNQLMSVSITIGSTDYLVKEYTYNQDGTTATVRDYYNFKDGTSEYLNLAYTYDALGRISEMLYTNEDGTTVERHSYEYDKNNNITREENLNSFTDLYEARVYTYDYAGQLKTSVISNITETLTYVENGEVDENGDAETEEVIAITETPYLTTVYTYDAVGNREQKTENGVTTTYTYNGLNQLVTEAGTETLTYDYDSNGNQISITGGSTNKYFTYTPAGMLATYTSGSDSQVNLYNGNGQRVKKTEGTDVTNYFYQNDSVLYTTDDTGALKSFNLLNVADAFATSRIDGSSESYYFYTEDQRGSTVNVLDNSGNQMVSYWYGDYGEVIESKATGYSGFINEIQYTGAIYDELTGLLYLNARFYDPSTGRFITQDTYRGEWNKPSTWHLYVYCVNNPIALVDPSGHSPWNRVLLLRDYRTVHEMVANLYALQLGLDLGESREIFVRTKYANKAGRYKHGWLDIYDYNNHRYYEVKSKGAANRNSTKKQMDKYDRSTVISPKYSKYNNVLLKKGRTSKSNEFYYGTWLVSYNYYKAGLVRYTVKPSQYTVDVLQGMAALTLVAGVFFLPKSLVVLGLVI